MGFKDKLMKFAGKAKHFMGKHGVKVVITQIERQAPHSAEMSAEDTVVKGKFEVTCENSDIEILSMKAEFLMETEDGDGETSNLLLGEDIYPDEYTSRDDDMLQYPYTMNPGDTQEDGFIISMDNFTITEALQERNVALSDAKFYIKVTVDVKGSPFDPEVTCPLTIIG